MRYPFVQGWLDSLCGIYAIVNAESVVNNTSFDNSQYIFNDIILYLSKKKMLKSIILNGIDHKWMSKIIYDVVYDKFSIVQSNKRNFSSVSAWWKDSQEFLLGDENRAIILSLDGKEEHYTVIKQMTTKSLFLFDSGGYGGIKTIRRSSCKLKGYNKDDKYIIFPYQCWFLGN